MKEVSLVSSPCPVCSHNLCVPFFDGGNQPIATLGWPKSAAEAQAMSRHPHDFMQCPSCSHVWNRSFNYDVIPYEKNPNRMFNAGGIWKGHLAQTGAELLAHLPPNPVVVEIGCGEGHFVRGLSHACNQKGRFVGFDPNGSEGTGDGVEFYARLFDPLVDMAAFQPDVIIIRHVLEHLTHPALLIEQLAWGSAYLDKPCLLFAEVPCIDRVFETGRLADFFYEHVGQFTTDSFTKLMQRAGLVDTIAHGYNGEVIYGITKLNVNGKVNAQKTHRFAQGTVQSRIKIREQLGQLANEGLNVVIWGGTGKAATFIHQFNADAKRFPLVVDSDPDKMNTYVPGTGQEIVFRDVLKGKKIDVVIVPPQWRVNEVIAEMARENIVAGRVLIEHNGSLIDFHQDDNPYRVKA
jgi:hypothetical protein